MRSQLKTIKKKASSLSYSSKTDADDLISLNECKKHLDKYNLSDQKIEDLRNSLIGIVDSVINSYLNNYR